MNRSMLRVTTLACLAAAGLAACQTGGVPTPADTEVVATMPAPVANTAPTEVPTCKGVQETVTDGVPMPPSRNATTANDVMYLDNAKLKTIAIYNNTEQPIFPIMEANNQVTGGDGLPMYDPHETSLNPGGKNGVNEEYRAYVGYVDGSGTQYLGLRPGKCIDVPVPMALWDGGRLSLVAGASPVDTSSNIPFTFHGDALDPAPNNRYSADLKLPDPRRYVQAIDDSGGLLLLYHAPQPEGLVEDAPFSFLEYAIRDATEQPGQSTSFDYDISYLDNMFLPVAAEAEGGTDPFNKIPSGYQAGYVGTIMPLATMQKAMTSFGVSSNNTLLGDYFGGKGWPQFYLSKPSDAEEAPNPADLVRMPGGYNILALSSSPSSYDVQLPMLTSSEKHPADAPNYAAKTLTNLWFSWANYWRNLQSPVPDWPPALNRLLADVTLAELHPADPEFAKAFSKNVYDVLAGVATVFEDGHGTVNNAQELIQYIIGWTLPPGFTGNRTTLMDEPYQDTFKSAIRGVLDYKTVPADQWYPDPKPTGSDANYNLDPWVWFVHKGITQFTDSPSDQIYAYAFSVDDDYGNILIPDANRLIVTVGGSNGLINTQPWQQ